MFVGFQQGVVMILALINAINTKNNVCDINTCKGACGLYIQTVRICSLNACCRLHYGKTTYIIFSLSGFSVRFCRTQEILGLMKSFIYVAIKCV